MADARFCGVIRLTKQTDYGIVLLSYLALHPDERVNAPVLSAATQLPLPMVSKILKRLAREGVLESQRGSRGGYQLSRSASDISVADIISALEGPIAITECIEDGPDECSFEASCRIRSHWQTINTVVREALDKVKLADMAGSSGKMRGVLDLPLVVLGGASPQ
jgi:FeS assembly SUF system regulator